MKRYVILLLALAGPPTFAADDPAAMPDPAAAKVTDCLRANWPSQLSIGSLELTAYDAAGGPRTLKGRLYARKSTKNLLQAALRIDAPVELKGAAYLVQETDDYLRDGMFVYLPSVRRPRRVTGSFADGSLLGTNFSYFEFKQLQSAFGDLRPSLEGTEAVNGRDADVLRFAVVPGAETRYTAVKAWVDKQACVVVQAEFYEGKKLSKQLGSPAGAIKQSGSIWYVAEYQMKEPSLNTRTVMRVSGVDATKSPPAAYFDPNTFFIAP